MNTPVKPRPAGISLAALALAGHAAAQPSPFDWKSIEFPDGQRLEFRAQLPADLDRDVGCPIALVFAGGTQDRAAVWDELAAHWYREAIDRGWGVVMPVAPPGKPFGAGGDALLPALLRNLRTGMRIEGNRIHAVGIGAGARGARSVVASSWFEFATLITIGKLDPAAGEIELRESVVTRAFDELDAAAVWQELDARRAALAAPDTPAGRVATALDDWHDAAARADADRYFGAMTDDAVFLGTDPGERWTAAEFRAFGAPYFERRSAWIYVPVSRNVTVGPDGDVAWFDEVLGHAKFGTCRGTGVLRMIDGGWRIAQFNLSVPIPNDLLGGVVEQIERARK